MKVASYDRQGPAADVLVIRDLPDPDLGFGEVRGKIAVSGVNPIIPASVYWLHSIYSSRKLGGVS
jgi:hypothetical protein